MVQGPKLKTYRWLFGLLTSFMSVTSPGSAHEDNFEDRVRDYILNNPEIILEALETLSERQAQAALVEKIAAYPDLFEGSAVLGIGSADATVRVVKFFDYKCVPCKAIHPHLEALVTDRPDLLIEMKHLPILTPGSERAARFALATQLALGDAAYVAVHEALWQVHGPLNTVGFKRIADDLGLDFARIEEAMDAEPVTAEVDGNRDIAIDLGILGTPGFLTSDSLVVGETNTDRLAALWLSQ